MEKHEKKKRMSVEELISETAKATADAAASEVVRRQRRNTGVNLYRATEQLLRAYPNLKKLAENPDDYGFVPVEKSKSITVAPPPGSGVHDHEDMIAEAIKQRADSYVRSCMQYAEINSVVRLVEDRKEFVVIRMYYFGEDYLGNPRPEDSRYTWEEIAAELAAHGIFKSEHALRVQRTKLVQEMTVLLFGVDGALSVESRALQKEQPNE